MYRGALPGHMRQLTDRARGDPTRARGGSVRPPTAGYHASRIHAECFHSSQCDMTGGRRGQALTRRTRSCQRSQRLSLYSGASRSSVCTGYRARHPGLIASQQREDMPRGSLPKYWMTDTSPLYPQL
jgi:hypothetical protein